MACGGLGLWNGQAVPGKLPGATCPAGHLEKSRAKENDHQTPEKMNLQKIGPGIQWPQAFEHIFNCRQTDFDPVLVIKEDDPHKNLVLRKYFSDRKDVLSVRLGECTTWKYISAELLLQLDPAFAHKRMDRKDFTHAIFISRLKKKVAELSFNPVIVIENCHYLNFNFLFTLLRMINELEGKARFVFVLISGYEAVWSKAELKNLKLNFFLKQVTHQYEIIR
jgi:hypothetical protein